MSSVSVAAALYWPLKFLLDEKWRKEYPKVMEWWERLMEVEEVGKAFQVSKSPVHIVFTPRDDVSLLVRNPYRYLGAGQGRYSTFL